MLTPARYAVFLLALLLPNSLNAQTKQLAVPNFFSDHMVLQRDCDAAIWGWAEPDTSVRVVFKGEEYETKSDAQGRWKTKIATGAADASGASLSISSQSETLKIDDVLVGEVWFASGQSNMVFTMNRVPAYAEVIAESDHPNIRMFNAPTVTAVEPQTNIEGAWTACSPETVPGYSAVAFFFARKLNQELDVPVGVIKSAWGGKPVETFTSREALLEHPATQAKAEAAIAADQSYDPAKALATYEVRLKKWQDLDAAWKGKPAQERGRRPRKPQQPKRPFATEGQPGVLFNSMIHPFVGYNVQGAIWYQGEANAKTGAIPYDQTLPLLIEDWRTRWEQDFSFYFVQLANFKTASQDPGNNDPWPLLQDRMRRILATTPGTGMAIINDVGEAKDIHPKNKHDVGERLALWALAKDYERDLVYCGPLYKSHEVEGGTLRIQFDHVGTGLAARDEKPLARFEIAGTDHVWHWAEAKITAPDQVTVSAKNVPSPVAVRYAWAANPEGANLVNSAGLPASIFRTDEWDDVIAQLDTTSRIKLQRQQLSARIKELAAQKKSLKRGSQEFQTASAKHQELMQQWRQLAADLAQ